uniref:Cysteine proteinase 4 n=1 Tax=Necator americanus TaxID=51031 RepID=A1YUM6_NECAM|nr:cysteine proteinase 4 [Necator americanus]
MKANFALVVVLLAINQLYADELLHKQESEHGLSGQALVDYVNSHQSLFKTEYSPTNEQFVKARIMDIKYMTEASHKYPRKGINLNVELPERFDAREKWPHCASIGLIRDHSACGSCWAVSAASVMSDRLCIQTNGTNQKILSSADILACCGEDCGSGCEGGYPIQAYFYLENTGVCSGGEYREKNVCKPYPFYPCDGNYGPCPKEGAFDTPKCRKICQFRYPVPYEEDKVFGKNSHILLQDNEARIRQEIFINGPVGANFYVFEDFIHYKEGIYKQTYGKWIGVHAIKLIGWGTENGTDYWLVANSYNYDWGENGTFRILRGTNHCLIESQVIATEMIV